MATVAEASISLLSCPMVEDLGRCHRAVTGQLPPVLARQLLQRDPFSPFVIPEDRVRAGVAAAPSSSSVLQSRPQVHQVLDARVVG